MKKEIKVLKLDDPEVKKTKSPDSVIILDDKLSTIKVLSLCIQSSFRHVVQTSNLDCDAEIKVSTDMIQNPESFLLYPLSNIFGAENPSTKTEKELSDISTYISQPKEKTDIIEHLVTYVEKYSNPKSLSDDVRMVADELITNSIYNAPFVDKENSNSGPNRTVAITIDQNKKPHVFAGCDSSRLVVGCTDYYGRLNIKKFIERIEWCYKVNPRDVINFGPGGAGIGSYMIFNLSVSFYVAVDPGVSTTVVCAFPLKMSAKKRQLVPKNIHIIYREQEASRL
jgi:hypothetical protein